MATRAPKYWSFISYSHADEKWADWIHKSLETYRIPRAVLESRQDLPKRLFPVFRDREELSSAPDLPDRLEAALAESRTLIALCSPRAAASAWVGKEIARFKSLGKADRVFCMIVDGEPYAETGSGELECFPDAVKFEVDGEGAVSDRPAEPLAADVRPGKDGKADGFLKLVSGILGVGFDELKQRDVERRKRRRRNLALAAVGALAVTGVLVWYALLGGAKPGWQFDASDRRLRLADGALELHFNPERSVRPPRLVLENQNEEEVGSWAVAGPASLEALPDGRQRLVLNDDPGAWRGEVTVTTRRMGKATGMARLRFVPDTAAPALAGLHYSVAGESKQHEVEPRKQATFSPSVTLTARATDDHGLVRVELAPRRGKEAVPTIVGERSGDTWSLPLKTLAAGRYSAALLLTDRAGNQKPVPVAFSIQDGLAWSYPQAKPTGIAGGRAHYYFTVEASGKLDVLEVMSGDEKAPFRIYRVGDQTEVRAVTFPGKAKPVSATALAPGRYALSVQVSTKNATLKVRGRNYVQPRPLEQVEELVWKAPPPLVRGDVQRVDLAFAKAEARTVNDKTPKPQLDPPVRSKTLARVVVQVTGGVRSVEARCAGEPLRRTEVRGPRWTFSGANLREGKNSLDVTIVDALNRRRALSIAVPVDTTPPRITASAHLSKGRPRPGNPWPGRIELRVGKRPTDLSRITVYRDDRSLGTNLTQEFTNPFSVFALVAEDHSGNTFRVTLPLARRDALVAEMLFPGELKDRVTGAPARKRDCFGYGTDRFGGSKRAAAFMRADGQTLSGCGGPTSYGYVYFKSDWAKLARTATISLWLKPRQRGGWLIGQSDGGKSGRERARLQHTVDGPDRVKFVVGRSSREIALIHPTPVGSGWALYVMTMKKIGRATQVWLYRGSDRKTVTKRFPIPFPIRSGRTERFYVGGFRDEYLRFDGAIDDIRIWARELSALEKQALYAHGPRPLEEERAADK